MTGTMTISEATAQGIARLRRPEWHDRSYIKMDLLRLDDGEWGHGPWFHLYDITQPVIGEPTPQNLLFNQVPKDGWLEYAGDLIAPDSAEQGDTQ